MDSLDGPGACSAAEAPESNEQRDERLGVSGGLEGTSWWDDNDRYEPRIRFCGEA